MNCGQRRVSDRQKPEKGRFHEVTNHNDERDKTADDQKRFIDMTDLIGQVTNILYLSIVYCGQQLHTDRPIEIDTFGR